MADFIEKKTQDLYREHDIHFEYEEHCSTCFSNRQIKNEEIAEFNHRNDYDIMRDNQNSDV